MPEREIKALSNGFILYEEKSGRRRVRFRTRCGLMLCKQLYNVPDFDGRMIRSFNLQLAKGFHRIYYPRAFQPEFLSQSDRMLYEQVLLEARKKEPPEFVWQR